MPFPTGLRRDEASGLYHLRIGIPDDVRPYWPLKPNGRPATDAYRKSLRTHDRAEAVRKAHSLLADYHGQFASLRERNRPRLTQLTPKLVAYLEGQIKHELLDGDDVRGVIGVALEGVPLDLREELGDGWTDAEMLHMWAEGLKRAHAQGGYAITIGFVNMFLRNIGLPQADWDQQAGALARLGRALAGAYEAIAQRATGELIATPAAPEPYLPEGQSQPKATEARQRTLRDVVEPWTKLTKAKPNAVQRTNFALGLWESAVGLVPLDQITRETGGEFVLYLLDDDRDFGRKTAKNHAACVNALMNVATSQGYVETNPLKLGFTVDDSKSREPWTREELQALHGKPVTGVQPLGVDAADANLLVNMLLWSGARISEIAGLRVEDVQEREGVLAAYIRRETTKEDASVRWLPIAAAIRPMVSAHAKRRQEEGSKALFPSFHRRSRTTAGDLAGRWFREHREHLGLAKGALHGSHRWRHTVRNELVAAGLGEALLDAVTGHQAAGGSAGRKNYTHLDKLPLARVLDAIERLAWPWPARSSASLTPSPSRGSGSVEADHN